MTATCSALPTTDPQAAYTARAGSAAAAASGEDGRRLPNAIIVAIITAFQATGAA